MRPAGQDPLHPAAALEEASAAATRGDAFAALDLVRRAVASRELLRERWAPAVKVCSQLGDDDAALLAARRLWQETPPSAQTAFILARTLEATGRIGEGISVLAPLAQAGELSQTELIRLARLLMFAGKLGDAEALVRRLLREDPHNPVLWEQLAQTKRFVPDDPDLAPLLDLQYRLADAPPASRARAAWAWGKAQVDIGDDKLAARALDAAAALRRKVRLMDMDSLEETARNSLEAVPPESMDAAAAGRQSERVMFILGPQRSGTTLLEQILCSHPDVAGGGEVPFLPLMRHVLGDFSPGAISTYLGRQRDAGSGDLWAPVRDRYLSLADERFGRGARFTDKLLSNVFRLGVIRAAFPGARVLRLRRDPLEVAWSCWRANFDIESAWSSSARWLARYIASYERLMDAWMERYPGWILEVDYAQLVTNPDQQIPRVLAHCGLSDHPATRNPHLNERGVVTSSFAQVRQPISAGSLGRAKEFPLATEALRKALRQQDLVFAE